MSSCCGLGIEASSEQLSLGACLGERLEVLEVKPARRETQALYRHAEALLARVGAGFAQLQFVAYGCGPGSFTGVRVAAAAAQALAFARGVAVCRASSLAVLAAGAGRLTGPGLFAIAVDARMGRAFVGLYRAGGGSAPEPVEADRLVDPASFVFPGAGRFTALGNAWQACPGLLARHGGRVAALRPDLLPSARDLLSIAVPDFLAGRVITPAEALPEYLGQAPAVGAH